MTTFLFLRHGQSMTNRDELFAGQYDTPLSPSGYEQAERAGKYIAENYQIDAIVSSDLIRARETAKPAARLLGLPVRTMPGLREIHVGEWENQPFDVIKRGNPAAYTALVTDDRLDGDAGNVGCPGGETIGELFARVRATFLDLFREYEGKTLLVVTHATPIRVLECWIRYAGDLSRLTELAWVKNASLTIVREENGAFRIDEKSVDFYLSDLKSEA